MFKYEVHTIYASECAYYFDNVFYEVCARKIACRKT